MPDNTTITDAVHSDPAVLEENAGATGKYLIRALDKAVHLQTGAIENYISWLRKNNPDKSPAELQKLVDKHFLNLATGSGAGVGLAAAVPGIGFVTGALAVGAESLVFLDAAAFYTMASAHLRGIDIRHPERRRGLILVVLLGSAGKAIVDAAVGDLSKKNKAPGIAISRFNIGGLMEVNGRLMKYAIKQVNKRFRAAWVGKILPFGIGAVMGTIANRKIANKTIGNAYDSLGPLPATF
ncbi:hypothetical protein CDES_05470 [Corynebacterium deserti GIMN1.010]|uniref:EcsC family protein n=1 Tax=Corynebacterium deserti GIMN1.010 TaxID=931089 RepID=A0A0M5ILH1_9CORY|nr:hypothetical protein [Corynebacterium deserti]ALC05531.1 hypothetical protein CDES_05470 [Corynebacterium deserti GIMN1.010]